MTTAHDTAAALEAAIRTFGVCAYSPSEPSDPYGIAGAHIWIEIEDYAAPLKAAITAHVEAEVALRLAAAPDVEVAIVDYALAAQGDFDTSEERDALRAAIAADKARAVANARRIGFKAGSAERSSVHDAIGVSPQEAARAAMAHGVPCPTCGSEARPTPDEAHRMINELIGATAIIGNGLDDDPGTVVAKRIAKDARTALLRALGVEA